MLDGDDPPDRGHVGMRIGERIDPPVLHDPGPHPFGKLSVNGALHEIAGEVAEEGFGGAAGEEEVGEVIQLDF